MDVCTLIVAQFLTLQMCVDPVVCREENNRQYCSSRQPRYCAPPPSHYECVTREGGRYILPLQPNDPR